MVLIASVSMKPSEIRFTRLCAPFSVYLRCSSQSPGVFLRGLKLATTNLALIIAQTHGFEVAYSELHMKSLSLEVLTLYTMFIGYY